MHGYQSNIFYSTPDFSTCLKIKSGGTLVTIICDVPSLLPLGRTEHTEEQLCNPK